MKPLKQLYILCPKSVSNKFHNPDLNLDGFAPQSLFLIILLCNFSK